MFSTYFFYTASVLIYFLLWIFPDNSTYTINLFIKARVYDNNRVGDLSWVPYIKKRNNKRRILPFLRCKVYSVRTKTTHIR